MGIFKRKKQESYKPLTEEEKRVIDERIACKLVNNIYDGLVDARTNTSYKFNTMLVSNKIYNEIFMKGDIKSDGIINSSFIKKPYTFNFMIKPFESVFGYDVSSKYECCEYYLAVTEDYEHTYDGNTLPKYTVKERIEELKAEVQARERVDTINIEDYKK